jgi:hypothetical protein
MAVAGWCALDRLLDAARVGKAAHSFCVASRGLANLRSWRTRSVLSSGFRITRASGIESEVNLAFVGLHQLCASVLDRLERLPTVGRTPFRVDTQSVDSDTGSAST